MRDQLYDAPGHAARFRIWLMARSAVAREGRFGRLIRTAAFDGPRFGTSRKLAPRELRLVLLAMLGERPGHGHDLIERLEARSGGFYRPGPAVIHASLAYLERLGQMLATPASAGKFYSISEAGRRHLARERRSAEVILAELDRIGKRMGTVRRTFADGVSGEEETVESEEYRQARRALKHALTSKRHANQEQVRIINAILERAAGEIQTVGGED